MSPRRRWSKQTGRTPCEDRKNSREQHDILYRTSGVNDRIGLDETEHEAADQRSRNV